jgi:uncharacterized protein YciI
MALEMRPACESCGAGLTPGGRAHVCSHECTFCPDCAWRMEHVCPNCGGELVTRPRRRAPGSEGEEAGAAAPPLFAYVIRPTRSDMLAAGPTPAEAEVVRRHYEYLRGLTAVGTVVLAARTMTADESSFGIVVLHAPDEGAARVLMERDPAVAEDVMRSELFPYRIALWGEFDRATI